MSFLGLGGMFGGDKGADFQGTGVNNPQLVNSQQLGGAGNDTGQGLAQQQAFINALGSQNGIGNQSNAYNQQSNILGQQQALANQLQMQAAGGGPNPALNQLALTTGQNTQNQAALMAGQRGVSNNPGLMARQIAQQRASNQQNAAGQAAVMAAQQQLAAQQGLMNQQSSMGNVANNMGNLANTQVGQQQGAIQQYNQNALGQQGMLLNAAGNQNAQNIAMQSNLNNVNAGIAGGNQKFQSGLIGGLLGGGSAAAGQLAGGAPPVAAAGAYKGGVIGYDTGGSVQDPNSAQSFLGKFLGDFGKSTSQMSGINQAQQSDNPGLQAGQKMGSAMANGVGASFAADGGRVSGKAMVPGDSPKNDTVPAKLSPGEVVVPRSKVHDEHKLAAFLNGLLGTNLQAGGKR